MSNYKTMQAKNGRIMYFKDNHLISKKDIPAEMLPEMTGGKDATDVIPEPNESTTVTPKKCLMCGKRANHSRFVNLQTVDLCERCYYDTNIGQIAQQLKG